MPAALGLEKTPEHGENEGSNLEPNEGKSTKPWLSLKAGLLEKGLDFQLDLQMNKFS